MTVTIHHAITHSPLNQKKRVFYSCFWTNITVHLRCAAISFSSSELSKSVLLISAKINLRCMFLGCRWKPWGQRGEHVTSKALRDGIYGNFLLCGHAPFHRHALHKLHESARFSQRQITQLLQLTMKDLHTDNGKSFWYAEKMWFKIKPKVLHQNIPYLHCM